MIDMQIITNVQRHLGAGDLARAAEACDAIAEGDRSATVLTLKGVIASRGGDEQAAEDFFRRAASLDQDAVRPRMLLAPILAHRGEWAEVRDLADEILAIAPEDAKALELRARAVSGLGDAESEGLAWLAAGRGLGKRAAPFRRSLAAFRKQGDWEQAAAAAEEGLAITPDDPTLLQGRARAMLALKRWDEVVAPAAALAESAPELALSFAQRLFAAGAADAAAVVVASVREQHPEIEGQQELVASLTDHLRREAREKTRDDDHPATYRSWRALALLLPDDEAAARGMASSCSRQLLAARQAVKEGRLDVAKAEFTKALQLEDAEESARQGLARIAASERDWEGVCRQQQELLILAPQDPDGWAKLAAAAERANRMEVALSAYQALAQLGSDVAQPLQRTVRRLLRQAREALRAEAPDDAAHLILLVLEQEPENQTALGLARRIAVAHHTAMRAAHKEGREDEALLHAEAALAVDPNRRAALLTASSILMRRKDHARAAEHLRHLTEVEPQVATHWVRLARCCRVLKAPEAEKAALERAEQLAPRKIVLRAPPRSTNEPTTKVKASLFGRPGWRTR